MYYYLKVKLTSRTRNASTLQPLVPVLQASWQKLHASSTLNKAIVISCIFQRNKLSWQIKHFSYKWMSMFFVTRHIWFVNDFNFTNKPDAWTKMTKNKTSEIHYGGDKKLITAYQANDDLSLITQSSTDHLPKQSIFCNSTTTLLKLCIVHNFQNKN